MEKKSVDPPGWRREVWSKTSAGVTGVRAVLGAFEWRITFSVMTMPASTSTR